MTTITVQRTRTRPSTRSHHSTDLVVLTGRNLAHIAREPLRLSDVTIQPVVFTLLFVYVLAPPSPERAATHSSP